MKSLMDDQVVLFYYTSDWGFTGRYRDGVRARLAVVREEANFIARRVFLGISIKR
jgi:hypothetical protein